MMQKLLVSVLPNCERKFRRVKGYALIPEMLKKYRGRRKYRNCCVSDIEFYKSCQNIFN